MSAFDTNRLEELTYLTCNAGVREQFEAWIAGMTEKRDGEMGLDGVTDDGVTISGFLTWIQDHNRSPEFTPNGLFQTFFWRDTVTGEIVATATVGPDDRGIKKTYQLGGDGIIGGCNVRWDLHYQGLGKFVCARVNEHIEEHAAKTGRKLQFHFFTLNPAVETVCARMGFLPNPLGEVHIDAFGDERLWTKDYVSI